jgi:multiple sugar transport system permease protein/sn-glycerol 3-phosphate transport system permease protein
VTAAAGTTIIAPSTRRVPRAMVMVPWLYLAPLIVLLGLFTFWPLIHTAYLSVTSWNLIPGVPVRFVGIVNYEDVIDSELFRAAVSNTLVTIFVSIPLKVLLPIPFAVFIWSLGRRGEFYRTVLFLPTLISFVAVSVAWLWILSPLGGYLDLVLSSIGIRLPPLLTRAETALGTVIGISTWKVFGFNVLLYLAGLTRIPHRLIDAMRVDGSSDGVILRRLIWPLLGPTTLFVLISTVIFTMQQVFTPIDMLTKGGPSNATTNLFYVTYQYTFLNFSVGQGAAATVILFVFLMVVALIKFRIFDRLVHYR